MLVRLLPSLPVDRLGLELSSNVCLLTQFIIMGLNVCDTYLEFKVTANTSKVKMARAVVSAHEVYLMSG